MDCVKADTYTRLRLTDKIFDPIREPKPDETSRFLNILDSPTNSDDGSNKNPFFNDTNCEPTVPEEAKNCKYFPTKVLLAKNLPFNCSEYEILQA